MVDFVGGQQHAPGVVRLARRPIEIGERQPCRYRLRIGFGRLDEGGFRFGQAAAGLLHRSETGVAAALAGIELDGLLNLVDGPLQVLQAGERIREQDLRLDVPGIPLENIAGPGLGILMTPPQQQKASGLQLCLVIGRQEIRGAHVFRRGRRQDCRP